MKKYCSLYIDLLRIFAALGVFLGHFSMKYFSNFTMMPFGIAHYCVVVFFVLSGYLICFTTTRNKKTLREYTSDRFSRLYSIIFPALIFTYLLDGIGLLLNQPAYLNFINPSYQWLKFGVNLIFLQQSSFFNTNPSTNNPFWSLSYEFWYYAFFGAYLYLTKWKRAVILILIAGIMGIKIAMLFPVWLFGASAFYLSLKIKVNTSTAIIFVLLTMAVLVWMFATHFRPFPQLGKIGFAPFYYSADVFNDTLYGFILALNLLSISLLKVDWKGLPESAENKIKYISAATFSLYVFHFPIMVFMKAVINYDSSNIFQVCAVLFFILSFILVISGWLEKSRKSYSNFFNKLFQVRKKSYGS